MTAVWMMFHLAGVTAWLGGLLAIGPVRATARREGADADGAAVRWCGGIYRILVGPGAMVTVVSGMILTLRLYGEATSVGLSHALMAMQGLGLVAALVSLVVSVPTAARLARLEPAGPSAPLYARLDRRLRLADGATLVSGLLALAAGALGA